MSSSYSEGTRAVLGYDCCRSEQSDHRQECKEGRGLSSVRFPPASIPMFVAKLTDVGPRYVYRKHAVEQTEMLDFLREIVQSVPDPSAGGTIDLDGDDGDGRRRRGPARKRKRKGVDNDMDEDGEGAEEDRTFVSMNKRAEASVGRAEGGSHKGRWRVKQSAPHDDEDEE